LLDKTVAASFQLAFHRQVFNLPSIGKFSTCLPSASFQLAFHRQVFNLPSVGKLSTCLPSASFQLAFRRQAFNLPSLGKFSTCLPSASWKLAATILLSFPSFLGDGPSVTGGRNCRVLVEVSLS
jgi:hypothetical protein